MQGLSCRCLPRWCLLRPFLAATSEESVPSKPSVSLTSFDKALVATAGLASKSVRLSPAEKRELKTLAAKGAKSGRSGFTMADRARCIWLIRRAGPDQIPEVKVPKPLRRLVGKLTERSPSHTEAPRLLRQADPTVDPLDRVEKLGRLRGQPLTEEQFQRQLTKILDDPSISAFGVDDGADPFDRLTRVSALETSGVLTPEQAAAIVEEILDAT